MIKSEKEKFSLGLINNDIDLLNQVAKSDLHCHADRGANRKDLEEEFNVTFENPPVFSSIKEMDEWYDKHIERYASGFEGLVRRYKSMFQTAEKQNIKVFSPSFCLGRKKFFGGSVKEYINFIKNLQQQYAPNIEFLPELVLNRCHDITQLEEEFEEACKFDFFKSIDIIGDESLGTEKFKEIYKKADQLGWILKAHVGEFSGVESIKEAINNLNLDVINHGLAAIESKELMQYLAKNEIKINICPTSNVLLARVKDYGEHPIKRFIKEGIICSINTDDLLIFNQSISEEYLNLYNSGALNIDELNQLRENGLTKMLEKRKKIKEVKE